jgi:hypothetical protein
MGTITKLNNVLCANISKVDNVLKANASKWDDNTFCPTPTPTTSVGTPTPTPTPTNTPAGATPSPTPTPTVTPSTPCKLDCCLGSLSYGNDCYNACEGIPTTYYLSICQGTSCRLSLAFGIYHDSECTVAGIDGYYADSTGCYYWDSTTLTLTPQGPC